MLLTYNTERMLFKAAAPSSHPPHPAIDDLPAELLIEILSYLHYRDILRCQSVSRYLRDVVRHCQELQYTVELAADGLVDGARGAGTPSTGERLRLLLDRRRRWRQLDWTTKHVVPVPGQCQAYEFVGGTFAKSMGATHGLDGVAGARHLNVTRLPGREAGHDAVIHEDLGVPTRDFAIDPSQDLVALVEMDEHYITSVKVKVHLRTISTNTKHPHAAKECLSVPIPFQMGNCFIQIVHDVIGMFFWLHGPGLLIWNWRTGALLVVRQPAGVLGALPLAHHPELAAQLRAPFDMPVGTWDFGFLSPRAFFLTSTDAGGALELFSFSSFAPGDAPTPPRHVASLRLPELRAGRTIHHFTTHAAPFLGGDVTQGVPFAAAQDDRVHVLSVTYGERAPRYHLFVKNSVLLALAEAQGEKKRVLSWEEWGTENTRFVEHNVQFQWLRYVHGHRVVLPPVPCDTESETDEGTSALFVMDFHVHPKRTHDPCDTAPHDFPEHAWNYEVVTVPSCVEAKSLFTGPVESRLPYAISHRIGDFAHTGFMIDDARIVGMKDQAFSEGQFNDIDVFTL